nr:MAG TPA: hypothetical protein [Caudoviricetes sp.]
MFLLLSTAVSYTVRPFLVSVIFKFPLIVVLSAFKVILPLLISIPVDLFSSS